MDVEHIAVMQSDSQSLVRTRNNFDELRILLASMVILDHSFVCLGRNEFLADFTVGRFHLGVIAVYGFFAISGYLVTQSWFHSSNAVDFVRKRCLRIYPALICAQLISAFIFAPIGGSDLKKVLGTAVIPQFFAGTFLLQDVPGPFPGFCTSNVYSCLLNAPLWSIRFEIVCYILLLVLGLTGCLKKKFLVLASLLLVQVVGYVGTGPQVLPYFGEIGDLSRLCSFFLGGVVLYLYEDDLQKLLPKSILLLAISLLFLLILPPPLDIFTTTFIAMHAIWVLAWDPRLHFFDAQRWGDYSYGLYVYGFPIQQLLLHAFHDCLQPLTLFVLAWSITFVFAFASWHCVEKPCLNLKKKRMS